LRRSRVLNYPHPSIFSRIYVHRSDTGWDVIGQVSGSDIAHTIEIDSFPNMVLADTFVRLYAEEYIKNSRFNPARDC
jgi:hypothetical protein